ncbi:MAG TPA: hypothetical protein VEC94_16180 [Pseudolabrys sp.]|nr:hypothetical protein [Pseudolabrys sp.]
MNTADKYSKIAAELYQKAGTEEGPYTRSELEMAAQIYVVLAERADQTKSKLDALAESDARGLQQQIAKTFAGS